MNFNPPAHLAVVDANGHYVTHGKRIVQLIEGLPPELKEQKQRLAHSRIPPLGEPLDLGGGYSLHNYVLDIQSVR